MSQTTRYALAGAVLAVGIFAGYSADAQPVCVERNELIDILGERFNETLRSFGLQADGLVLELYASPEGSWTALLTRPDGVSCVVASGEAWSTMPGPKAGKRGA